MSAQNTQSSLKMVNHVHTHMTTAVHVLDVLYLDRGGRQCNMKLLLLSEQIWKTKSTVPSLLAEQMERGHVYGEGDPLSFNTP